MLTSPERKALLKAGLSAEHILMFMDLLENRNVTEVTNVTKRTVTKVTHPVTCKCRNCYMKKYRKDKKHKVTSYADVTHDVTPVVTKVTQKTPSHIENAHTCVELKPFLLTSLESKKDIILTKMSHTSLPPEWKSWTQKEFGWDDETTTDVWQLFYEYWVNGKGKATKREKWGATWRTWCRTQAMRMKTQSFDFKKPRYSDVKKGVTTL
jgi:hypothetical protein